MRAWLRIPLQLATFGLLVTVAAAAVITGAYYYVEPTLSRADELRDISRRFQTPLRIYSADGLLMSQYGAQKRIPADLEDIPARLRNAVIAAEDNRFYRHNGIDLLSTARAIFNYAVHYATRSTGRVPGGSTITQQVTRTTELLPRDYLLGRKIVEIFLALEIERQFTKDEILEIYLNTYFFGQRSYGVVSTARTYFNKGLDQLTLSEAAIIAGIPTAPSRNNPYNSPENAELRRAYVLRRMDELGYIDSAEREAALAEPIKSELYDVELELEGGYVADMAIQWCLDRFGEQACATEGLRITTTVDSRAQRAANDNLRATLEDYDRNHGYRGPIGHIDFEALDFGGGGDGDDAQDTGPSAVLDTLLGDYDDAVDTEAAIVLEVQPAWADVYLRSAGIVSVGFDAVAWARAFNGDFSQGPRPEVVGDVLSAGDIVRFRRQEDGSLELAQLPTQDDIQGALVALDPADGAILALSGGYTFESTPFNRATQAERQPGSAFKPFFYLSALNRGYTLASVINDAPETYWDATLERYQTVRNYSGSYRGPTRLREVLINSLNASADRVIRGIGAGYTVSYLERFGFDEAALPRNASLALGSGSVTPLELAGAYAILANGGFDVGIRDPGSGQIEPWFVQAVHDADGNRLYDASLSVRSVCEEPAVTTDGEDEQLIELRSELFEGLGCAPRVESAQRIYLIVDVLKDVVRRGSGAAAYRALPRADIAGKTGTTQDARDAWFAGFNADLVTVARVGFDDDGRSLGAANGRSEQGGRTAIPAWIGFMQVMLDGVPESSLPRPFGIVERRINPDTGLLAADCNTNTIPELFLAENQPERESDMTCLTSGPRGPGEEASTPGSGSGRLFD